MMANAANKRRVLVDLADVTDTPDSEISPTRARIRGQLSAVRTRLTETARQEGRLQCIFQAGP